MLDRYLRQTMLNQIGPEGQRALARASVVIVGAGGLGSPALTYLVEAGVGRVGLIDSDTVSRSNLNRQFLYKESDVGQPKAAMAREALAALNADVEIIAHEECLCDGNAQALLGGYDLIVGAVDSMDTRFVINRASIALQLPYIDGGVSGLCGCVVFSQPGKTPCLQCVFPQGPAKKQPAGILGATAGVVGTIEANLALLWLLKQHNPIENKLLMYDGFRMRMDQIKIERDGHCPACKGGAI